MCRQCVWDILNLGVPRQMLADFSALLGDISQMFFGVKTTGENCNACIKIFLYIPMPWRSRAIIGVRRRSFAELLVHGDAALAIMPKFVHCESIGRLKKLRGTVALAGALGKWLAPLPFTPELAFGSRSRRFERNKKCFFPIHV